MGIPFRLGPCSRRSHRRFDMSGEARKRYGIEDLLAVMARLRDPKTGCPWDVKQSFATIAPYTIEEAYEVADAIARDDLDGLKDAGIAEAVRKAIKRKK